MQTITIESIIGVVTYVSYKSDNSKNVTVECPDEKIAVGFMATDLNTQDWVKINGTSRASNREKPRMYYHTPYDGTNKEDWKYYKLDQFTYKKVGDKALLDKMSKSMLALRRHLDSWENNRDLDNINATFHIINETLKSIKNYVNSRKPDNIVTRPEID